MVEQFSSEFENHMGLWGRGTRGDVVYEVERMIVTLTPKGVGGLLTFIANRLMISLFVVAHPAPGNPTG